MIISGLLDCVIIGKAGKRVSFTLNYINLFTIFFTLINKSILEKIYVATQIYILLFGSLCLVPRGSSPELYYQIVG